MNVDAILQAFADRHVEALLIDGMNFLFRHRPVLTYDVDRWVRDADENLDRVAAALRDLGAEWGRDEKSWGPVPSDFAWLESQSVFCLTTRQGAVDIFREVRGLEGQFESCFARAVQGRTAEGVPYLGLSDSDMLVCQLALPPGEQNGERIAHLRRHIEKNP